MTKQILVGEQLHKQVKAAAALEGLSIRVYAERALRRELQQYRPTPHTLIDEKVQYETAPEL